MTARLLCLHGHFYQPPRENPWIEEIEIQDSAAPFHDWNERVAAECYGPNGAARVKGPGDRIVDIVNNYLHLSFNFGPTLLAWLERRRPEVYARVLDADAHSREARGHGNALAQGYSHSILPLASPRDRRSQIRWGIADFRRRFRRDPEGFWLPETAADQATLGALAEAGIRFTILSPYQARRVRPPGGEWLDAGGARFDPTRPYRVRAGGRELVVFFYDGHIARDLAFGDALGSPERLVRRLEGGFDPARAHDEILTIAFDGETLGHHRKGADEALAAALRRVARSPVEIVNLGQALDRVPAEWEAEIVEGSSWSCAHGVERWRSDCGCQVGAAPGWHQRWRAPLLSALEGLRDRLAEVYERELSSLLADPWSLRDRYVELVLDPSRSRAAELLASAAGRPLAPEEQVKALRLLEMQRHSLLMFTSCGWFFAELSGLETVQVLKYAARAVQLAREAAGVDLEPELAAALASAPSNRPDLGDGRQVYERLVRPSVATLDGVAAHLAIASTARALPEEGSVFSYRYRVEARREARSGPAALTVERLRLESATTGEARDLLCCVLRFGAADFRCGIGPWLGPQHLEDVQRALFSRLEDRSVAGLLREIDRAFPGRDYALRALFLDERRRVAAALLDGTLRRYEGDYLRVFEDNLHLMEFLRENDSPVPGPLRVAAEVALSSRLRDVTHRMRLGEVSFDATAPEIAAVVELARRLGARLHLAPVRRDVEEMISARLEAIRDGRDAGRCAAEISALLALAERLGLRVDLWEAQNRVWEWAGSSCVGLDRDAFAELARHLWFDPPTLLRRAGLAGDA